MKYLLVILLVLLIAISVDGPWYVWAALGLIIGILTIEEK